MKIWIRKSNFRLELMIVKRFSVLQDFSTNLRMNALFKSNDIHASKIDLSNNIKKNNKKSNETFSKKDYLFEKEHNPNDLIDIKYITDTTQPALYSKLINNIIEKQYYMFNYGEQIAKQPQLFKDIIFKSSIPNLLSNVSSSQTMLNIKQIINFLKYVKLIFNYPIYIADQQILNLIKKCSDTLDVVKDQMEIIDFAKELINIRDKLETSKINKEAIDKLNLHIENCIKKKIFDKNNYFYVKYILFVEKEMATGNLEISFFKFVFILAKIKSYDINENFKFFDKFSPNLRTSFSNILHDFKLSKLNKKAIILYLNCLDSLKLNKDLTSIISQNLTLESLDLDYFHILYKTVLNKYKENISIAEIDINFFSIFSSQFQICSKKMKYIYDTFLFIVKNTSPFIQFHNNFGYIQKPKTFFFRKFFSKVKENFIKTSDPKQLFYCINLSMELLSNPGEFLSKLPNQKVNIFEVEKDMIQKYVDNLNVRLNYIWRFDHEIYLLKKLNKNTFEIFHEFSEKLVEIIIGQIVENLEKNTSYNKPIDVFYYEILLKSIKYLSTIDNYYEGYELSKVVKEDIHKFIKFLYKNIDSFLVGIYETNLNNLVYFSDIVKYLLHYSNSLKGCSTFNNEEFCFFIIGSFLKFVSTKLICPDDLMDIYKNLLEFYICFTDSELNTLSSLNKSNLNNILNQIQKVILKVDNRGKIDQSILKRSSNSKEAKFVKFLINYLYLLKKLNFRNENIIIIEKYIEKSTILRNLKSNYIFKLNESILTFNALAQIVSNLQTITIFSKKKTVSSHYLNKISLRNYFVMLLNSIDRNKVNENDSKNQIFNFSPLSSIASFIFNDLEIDQIIKLLNILGNKNLENYHPSFAFKLTQTYCNEEKVKEIFLKNEDNLFNFASNWPYFLKNEELLHIILALQEQKLLSLDMVGLCNLISYHHIIYPKIMDHVLKMIHKIRLENRKEIFEDFINNTAYLGYKLNTHLYEELLFLYENLNLENSVVNYEVLADLLLIYIVSDLNNILFLDKTKEIFKTFLVKLEEFLNNKIKVSYNNKIINCYPSITSEDRYFHKAISNSFNYLTLDQEKEMKIKKGELEEINNEDVDPNRRNYYRKGREASQSVEAEFESFFTKKKDLMYGNQSLLQEEFKIKPTLKYWLISNYFNFRNDEDCILSDEFNRLFAKVCDNYKKNKQYEKLYLNLVSFCMQNNLKLESSFYDEKTRMNIDYSVSIRSRVYFILYIPENETCLNYLDKLIEVDGLFKLISKTLRKNNPEAKIIHLFEKNLNNLTDDELKLRLYQLIDVLA